MNMQIIPCIINQNSREFQCQVVLDCFNDTLSTLHVEECRMVGLLRKQRYLKGRWRDYFEILSQNLPLRTKENHKRPQSRQSVSGQDPNLIIYHTRINTANRYIMTFSWMVENQFPKIQIHFRVKGWTITSSTSTNAIMGGEGATVMGLEHFR